MWLCISGIALFILGMRYLEDALHQLAGRPFKIWLKKMAANPLKAVAGGTLVTMLLQSSSIVNLLVLAMVGAGIIGTRHALALVLGANLGTTATSWIIVTLGFQLTLEVYALPVMSIAGILFFLTRQHTALSKWMQFLFGFGLLFTGLGFIKSGAEAWITSVSVSSLSGYPAIAFLFAGFIISSLVQSSSVTMAIALSVLATGAITLTDAMAIALGAEVGTTLKIVLASFGANAEKKRVALANLLFNGITTVGFMLLLKPMNTLITGYWHVKSPLIALVAFQSLVNIAGILLFLPIISPIGRWLDKRFKGNDKLALFISKVPVNEPDIALEAFHKELKALIHQTLVFAQHIFSYRHQPGIHYAYADPAFNALTPMEQYNHIKAIHGEIFNFYTRFHTSNTLSPQTIRITERLMSAARNTIYGAKSMRDSMADAENFSSSSKAFKYELFQRSKSQCIGFMTVAEQLLFMENNATISGKLLALYQDVQREYKKNVAMVYEEITARQLSETDVSTAINFNREITSALKSLVMSMKDLLLTEKESQVFEALPGFIR